MFGSSFKDNVIGTLLLIVACLVAVGIISVIGSVKGKRDQVFEVEVGSTECKSNIFIADSTGSRGENTTIDSEDPVWIRHSTKYTSKLIDKPQGLTYRFKPTFDTIRTVDSRTGVDTGPPRTVLDAEFCFSASPTLQPGEYTATVEMTFINPLDDYYPPTVLTQTFTVNVIEGE